MKKLKLNQKRIESFLLAFLITALVASIARLFSDTTSAWYLALNKPSIQPPNFVFPIAWGVIYILIAISLALFIYADVPQSLKEPIAEQGNSPVKVNPSKKQTKKEKTDFDYKKKVYFLYGLQAFLNILWNIVFFKLQSPALAFALAVVYLVIVYLTIREAYKFSPWSAYLQIPHLLWLLLATAINYMVVLIN